jgi:hypothetical protein
MERSDQEIELLVSGMPYECRLNRQEWGGLV